jgi:hypothetical protein
MTNTYEVAEVHIGAWDEDRSPIVSHRWACRSTHDALVLCETRRVEAEMNHYADVRFEARENGEPIAPLDDEIEDGEVAAHLSAMGYTTEEIEAAI